MSAGNPSFKGRPQGGDGSRRMPASLGGPDSEALRQKLRLAEGDVIAIKTKSAELLKALKTKMGVRWPGWTRSASARGPGRRWGRRW